ncbi:hypothetical protein ACFFWE_28860 [Sphaerisporangium melleum]|uniref:hypothetical protein n=1 Tax=Sphaerisporangium melleum TaxID=321316 RepID=UPI001E2C1E5A|nr:hypothetical protein [Sphaerisporangium melleum]
MSRLVPSRSICSSRAAWLDRVTPRTATMGAMAAMAAIPMATPSADSRARALRAQRRRRAAAVLLRLRRRHRDRAHRRDPSPARAAVGQDDANPVALADRRAMLGSSWTDTTGIAPVPCRTRPLAGSPGPASWPVTRSGPGRKTTWPSGTAPVTGSRASCCHLRTAWYLLRAGRRARA